MIISDHLGQRRVFNREKFVDQFDTREAFIRAGLRPPLFKREEELDLPGTLLPPDIITSFPRSVAPPPIPSSDMEARQVRAEMQRRLGPGITIEGLGVEASNHSIGMLALMGAVGIGMGIWGLANREKTIGALAKKIGPVLTGLSIFFLVPKILQ